MATGQASVVEQLKDDFLKNHDSLIEFLRKLVPPCGLPIYASIDIRDAGFKLAAVDVNLFPAGFNNLSEIARERAAISLRQFFAANMNRSAPWKIGLFPEAHTNNWGYLENLASLIQILKEAGAEVSLLWSGPPIPKPWTLKTKSGFELHYLPFESSLQSVDAILLNHDLSGGYPPLFDSFPGKIFPNPQLGWYKRRKSQHHIIVADLLNLLQEKFPWLDPWYFQSETKSLPFDADADLDPIAKELDLFVEHISHEYEKRKIRANAKVFLKNDAGTYGLGVMAFASGHEFLEVAQTVRRSFRKGKQSTTIQNVILQEAVPTIFGGQDLGSHLQWWAEPTLYLAHGSIVGGFFRRHDTLGAGGQIDNLNVPGSRYIPLESEFGQQQLSQSQFLCNTHQLNCGYQFLGWLHMVAAALEECPGGSYVSKSG